MAYDEEEARRRVVVETPTARREVVSESVRTPDRSGISAGMVGVLVVVAIALITMLVLFYLNNQQMSDQNLAAQQAAQQQTPTIIQQPAPAQPPVIVQQPAPATQPAPVIVTQPSGGAAAAPQNIDSTIQAAIDKTILDDPSLSTLGITTTVLEGKVTLLGTVKSESIKTQVERTVRRVKGVKDVDNQITVIAD